MSKKIKVVFFGDAPNVSTGFATVSKNILMGLHNTGLYDITVLGVNHWGDPHNFPFPIYPMGINEQKDPYGRQKAFNMLVRMEFDILFFIQDTFILDFLPDIHKALRDKGKKFKSVVYYPIDSASKKEWIENIAVCDYKVAYSNYGKDISLAHLPDIGRVDVIPHGANTKDFYVLDKDEVSKFRKQYFGPVSDKWIVANVNRNQQRKDVPRSIAAFKEFRKMVPNSVLYLHMASKDQGGDLKEVVKSFGLSVSKDVIFPENFGPNQGYPIQVLNLIYNSVDCIISTTTGEGFGLSWLEGMATKTPVIMPANTMLPEFITPEIGWLYKSGTTPSLHHVFINDNEVIRPLADIDDLVRTMVEVYNNKVEVDKRANNAYNWIKSKMEWQLCIVPQWIKLFKEIAERKDVEVVTPKINIITTEEF